MYQNPDVDRISLDKRIEAVASSGGGGGGGDPDAGPGTQSNTGFFPFYDPQRWYGSSYNGEPVQQTEGWSQNVTYTTDSHPGGNISRMTVDHILYYPTIFGCVCGPTAWAIQLKTFNPTRIPATRAHNTARFPVDSSSRGFIDAFGLNQNNYPKPILAEMRKVSLAYVTNSSQPYPPNLGPGNLNVKIYYERASNSVVYDMEIVDLPSTDTSTDAFTVGGVFFRSPTMGGARWTLDSTVNIIGGFPESSNGYFKKYGSPGTPARLHKFLPASWG